MEPIWKGHHYGDKFYMRNGNVCEFFTTCNIVALFRFISEKGDFVYFTAGPDGKVTKKFSSTYDVISPVKC